jgi:GAF domain/His Kinase A (phospho-acceptor) domain
MATTTGGLILDSPSHQPDTGMEMRDLLQDVEFLRRPKRPRDLKDQLSAVQRIAQVFAGNPETMLQELVDIAVEYCGADSAGISLEEGIGGEMRFRWVAIAGSFSHFLNGTTPRFFSPCGTTLSRGVAQLYRVTKPYYDYLHIEAEPITDGMLIPWTAEQMRGTIWAVSHKSREAFDIDDYTLLNTLADFAAIAIRHQYQQKALRAQEKAAAYGDIANELAHEINNPLQSLCNALYLAQAGRDTSEYLKVAANELERVNNLVKTILALKAAKAA